MESWKNWETPALVGVVTTVCLASLLVAGIAALRLLPEGSFKSADPAAWVQAIGSILAIAGTAFCVWWSHDLERTRLAKAEREQYEKVAHFIAHIAQQASFVLEDLEIHFESRLTGVNSPIADMAARHRALEGHIASLQMIKPQDLYSLRELEMLTAVVLVIGLAMRLADEGSGITTEHPLSPLNRTRGFRKQLNGIAAALRSNSSKPWPV